jgi:hypothetical protein
MSDELRAAEQRYMDSEVEPDFTHEDIAVAWLLAVRKFGLDRANLMFRDYPKEG